MIKVSKLYEYPVTITDEEFQEVTGINLKEELGVMSDVEAQKWLNNAHQSVYNRIYRVGGKTFKNRLITLNLDTLESTIKQCLIIQLEYMLDANGDYGIIDGSNTTPDGTLQIVDNAVLASKILAPKVVETLKTARPDLLMGDAEK